MNYFIRKFNNYSKLKAKEPEEKDWAEIQDAIKILKKKIKKTEKTLKKLKKIEKKLNTN
tara:strand:+ start:70 stop:246 length:177 start_codon:yes stop_codon:yes gene_type:complete